MIFILISLLAVLFIGLLTPFILAKKKAALYKKFFRVLWKDLVVRVGSDAILPRNLQESMKMYPELPQFDACFKMSPQKLIEATQWTIDPRDHGIKISAGKLQKRISKK